MRYVHFIVRVLLIFVVSGLSVWSKPAGLVALDKQVERQIVQAQTKAQNTTRVHPTAKQNPSERTERQKQITQALDKVRLKLDDPDLADHIKDYEQFIIENQRTVDYFQTRLEEHQSIAKGIEALFSPEDSNLVAANIITVKKKRPNYGKETKGVPFIYLTDASGHGTQSIVNEVQELMQQVRKTNPQARILLALEFAEMQDADTPIQFAGKINKEMYISAPYNQLAPLAAQLGMDILALDDLMFGPEEEAIWHKIGNQLLYIPTPYEQFTEKQWQEIVGFVNSSTLGIKLRNEQWVSYLRAVRSFYDIVIVYAGNGHLNSPHHFELDVPVQLAEKHVVFDFYTLEVNQENDEFSNNTYKMLCDAHACVMVPQTEENTVGTLTWNGESIVCEKTDFRAFKKYISTLPAEKQKQFSSIVEALLSIGFKNIDPQVQFDVYLPDVTKAAGK